ncbi:MAG: restriction endonuclease subunit S, partial [Kiritimatiellia bacterium]
MGENIEAIYGPLAKNWRMVRLKDLVENGTAELQTGPFGTMLHASAYQPKGTPVIAVQHIGENSLRQGEYPLVDDDDTARLSRYKVRENDILFGRKGAVDRRALIRSHESGWLQGSDCIRLRFNETIDARYISYVLGTSAYKQWIVRHAHGATMPSLNQEILGLIPLPLPPLPEQKRIAHILGTLDDKIELNQRMNATLEAMARVLFKSWFVDFDPVRAKIDGRKPEGMDAETAALFPSEFQESPLGPIPKGWKVQSLDKIAHYLNGLALQKFPANNDLTLPVIKIAQLRKGDAAGADRCSANIPSEYIVNDGDVLFSWSGSLEVGLWCGGRGALNQH